MLTLYDAPRCPYCARVRIVLAEKGVGYETVTVDLDERPAWIYEKNPLGKVPVIEEDTLVLAESAVIMEYLDERYPEPALLPSDAAARSLARMEEFRFDKQLGDDYYAFRRGDENRLEERLEALEVGRSDFVDIAYVPWVIRARDMLGLELPEHLETWLAHVSQRPSFAAEREIVAGLAAV